MSIRARVARAAQDGDTAIVFSRISGPLIAQSSTKLTRLTARGMTSDAIQMISHVRRDPDDLTKKVEDEVEVFFLWARLAIPRITFSSSGSSLQ